MQHDSPKRRERGSITQASESLAWQTKEKKAKLFRRARSNLPGGVIDERALVKAAKFPGIACEMLALRNWKKFG